MNRRAVLIVSLLLAAGVTLLLILRGRPAPRIAWEHELPEREYVHCLAIREDCKRPVLVAGIQQNNYGSRDFDSYLVCYDLETGDELWRRHESKAGNLRGGKRSTSIEFDSSGNLIVGWDFIGAKEDELYSVIDLSTGKPGSESVAPASVTGTESNSRATSIVFVAADGSEVTWGRHIYEHTETNWFKWRKEDEIWMPEAHWERRERAQVTRTRRHKSGSAEQFFVGGEQERVLLLLSSDGSPIPSAVLLVDMSEEAKSRSWRVVSLVDDHKLGHTLAQGVGISHNYGGPVRFTKAGSVIIAGNLLQDQSTQKITVWKQP
jgi:hypothetical protein